MLRGRRSKDVSELADITEYEVPYLYEKIKFYEWYKCTPMQFACAAGKFCTVPFLMYTVISFN